ncbi:hypothetical protein F5Y15DRAFT_368297 [Xylariaceae sp. FL0016]|nr:hypothetical protein F5Y15DRAFT_368297 [Xylariaceae sp. FL0016]
MRWWFAFAPCFLIEAFAQSSKPYTAAVPSRHWVLTPLGRLNSHTTYVESIFHVPASPSCRGIRTHRVDAWRPHDVYHRRMPFPVVREA